MARRGKGSKDYKDVISGFVSEIMNVVDFDRDTQSRIADRKKNMQVLLNSSKTLWDTDDAYVLGEFFKTLIEEVVYSECSGDQLLYKELVQEVIDAEDDDDDDSDDSRKTKKNGKDSKKVPKESEMFFTKFKTYLDSNDLTPRPTYVNFVRLVDKFKLKKIATFPNVDTTEELYLQWENFIGR